ncbi:MAG TPA: YeeE/YedE thiosulfate transporter family protein [Casimicrobiaceae bacterium]|jgi:toxin CptA
MDILLISAAFVISLFCAGLMGFAIQRGATCTVAAVDEFVSKRKLNRLISLIEASLWVVGGLLIAQAVHVLPRMPSGYGVGWLTIVGALLLGLGAFINGACVFGAIARLGSGEWAYVLTPLGFYVGCLTVTTFFPPPPPRLTTGSPLFDAAMWLGIVFGALMLFRVVWPLVSSKAGMEQTLSKRIRVALTSRIWSPHAATGVIGVTFVLILLLIGGTWAYTEVLADLSRGMANSLVARILLVIALFVGAIIGGYTAGRFRSMRITAVQTAKCFAGGMMMGWGTLLIPGSNDGLILIGMPLLRPYAWIAFLTMCISIGVALVGRKYLQHGVTHETIQHG